MLKAEQVPETVAHVAEAAWSKDATWQQIIAAAIDAWPGAIHNGHWLLFPHTKIPLPTENNNGSD